MKEHSHFRFSLSAITSNCFTPLFFLLPVLVLILHAEVKGQADAFIQPPGKGEVWVSGSGGGTRNYFNVDGNQRLFDSLETSFSWYVLGVSLDYGLMKGLELNVNVPIGYYSISSVSRFPDRSIFSPTWYGIGLTYQLIHGAVFSSVSSQVKIPAGFHDGIYDDPNHPSFLSDGYWQFTNTLNFGFTANDIWFKASGGYNMRGEEPADELLYSAQIGLSRIEGTGIFLGIDGVVSTEDASKPLRPFYAGASAVETEKLREDGGTGAFRTIDREDYLSIRPGAFISLNDHLTLSAEYFIRLTGRNSLALRGLSIAGGYRF